MVLSLCSQRHVAWNALIAIFLLTLASVSNAIGFDLDSAKQDELLPPDAANTKNFNLGWGKQISFSVERKYPLFAFQEADLEVWRKRGFRACKLQTNGWGSIVDKTGREAVRRFTKNMMLYDGSRLVLLVGQYSSSDPRLLDSRFAGGPDSTKQFGTMMVYGKSQEIVDQIIATEQADCR
jgi:hypothetical protein